jgi:glucose/mannose transport system substrate-binding protein
VQLKGPEIAEWNATGQMANLNDLAAKENWDKVVAPALLPVMKPTGDWVAAPMNIHRINWLWASTAAMAKAGIKEMPKTWAEYNAACDKAVAAGLICEAHFSADWTDSTVFEVVVYGQNIDLYKKAFVEGDTAAMRSPEMVKAFEQFRLMISKYMDPGIAGRDYDTATAMIAKGKAVFMIMGDWQIGIFGANKMTSPADYECAQAPTDWGKPGFILNSDSVAFFKQTDPDYVEGQKLLAHLILSPAFQTVFNQTKGSIPARLDVDISKGFSPCQQLSQKDLQASIAAGTLVRSFAHNMTILQKYRGAAMDAITTFVNNPKMSAKEGADAMADAVDAQK